MHPTLLALSKIPFSQLRELATSTNKSSSNGDWFCSEFATEIKSSLVFPVNPSAYSSGIPVQKVASVKELFEKLGMSQPEPENNSWRVKCETIANELLKSISSYYEPGLPLAFVLRQDQVQQDVQEPNESFNKDHLIEYLRVAKHGIFVGTRSNFNLLAFGKANYLAVLTKLHGVRQVCDVEAKVVYLDESSAKLLIRIRVSLVVAKAADPPAVVELVSYRDRRPLFVTRRPTIMAPRGSETDPVSKSVECHRNSEQLHLTQDTSYASDSEWARPQTPLAAGMSEGNARISPERHDHFERSRRARSARQHCSHVAGAV